jgi:peptidoglycan/LPS O-acetylase OafA/YrhL
VYKFPGREIFTLQIFPTEIARCSLDVDCRCDQYISVQRDNERKGQLDSLRAFAILPVLYTHFWNTDNWIGTAGVYLFFVLSGYLITGILLKNRGKPSALRIFYVRRALRIAPIYYLTLTLSWLILPGIRDSFPWHAFYLSNVWFTLNNGWLPWFAAHLWTLSVEEQFYLVWPFLILTLPLKAIRPALCCAILIAISFQLGLTTFGINHLGKGILIPASLDKFGVGALLAVAEAGVGFPRWLTKFGWAAFVAVAGMEFLPMNRVPEWGYVLRTQLLIVAFAALIAAASSGISGPAGAILDCGAVRYIGRISYGIYLFHLFAFAIVLRGLGGVGLPTLERGPAAFILLSAITIGIAALSWNFFEQPINRLKERFDEDRIVLDATVAP